LHEDDMGTLSTIEPFTCVACRLEIVGRPTFHLGLAFCCGGCAADGPCICSYDREPVVPSRVRHCLDVADPIDLAELADLARDRSMRAAVR